MLPVEPEEHPDLCRIYTFGPTDNDDEFEQEVGRAWSSLQTDPADLQSRTWNRDRLKAYREMLRRCRQRGNLGQA
jgi:hypothetical protein